MAYDRQFLSVDWLFRDISSDEVAVTGLSFSGGSGWDDAVTSLEQLDGDVSVGGDLILDMADLISTVSFQWASYSQLYGLKIAAIGTDGLYLTDPVIVEAVAPAAGASDATPPQCTIVMSLRSGSSIGRANYGRMFLPHTSFYRPTGQSQTTPTYTTIGVNAFAAFVNGTSSLINGVISETVNPMIMTNTSPSPSKQVLEVRVGSVTDTQRRRREQIVESYSSYTL